MPFVQATREKIEQIGITAMNLTLDFSEMGALEENKEYLKHTLEVIYKTILEKLFNVFKCIFFVYVTVTRYRILVF